MANIFDLFKSLGRSGAAGGPPEYILAGLGNPGITYDRTRHNTGFLVLDELLNEYGVKTDRSRFKGLCGEGTVGNLVSDDAIAKKVDDTVNSLNELLKDLKAHPKRYVHFSLFGKKDKADKK